MDFEITLLQGIQLLDENADITPEGIKLLARASYVARSKSRVVLDRMEIEYVEKYRELFPAGQFPSGASARASVKELVARFETFFGQHPELRDWNLILKATALYLDEAEQRSFEYTQNSENFIYKLDKFKNWQSKMAQYCEIIRDGALPVILHTTAPSIVNIPGL